MAVKSTVRLQTEGRDRRQVSKGHKLKTRHSQQGTQWERRAETCAKATRGTEGKQTPGAGLEPAPLEATPWAQNPVMHREQSDLVALTRPCPGDFTLGTPTDSS